jgi:WhiB family redox-sensing transcriptional regulator
VRAEPPAVEPQYQAAPEPAPQPVAEKRRGPGIFTRAANKALDLARQTSADLREATPSAMMTRIAKPEPVMRAPASPPAAPAPQPAVQTRLALDPTDYRLALNEAKRAYDAELWFAELPAHVEQAKALCRECPAREACLAGARERSEPWGVWGGELFIQGVVVPRKRPRGRPRVDEPGSTITVYVKASDHDRLIRLAEQHEQSVSALVRTLLSLRLRDQRFLHDCHDRHDGRFILRLRKWFFRPHAPAGSVLCRHRRPCLACRQAPRFVVGTLAIVEAGRTRAQPHDRRNVTTSGRLILQEEAVPCRVSAETPTVGR